MAEIYLTNSDAMSISISPRMLGYSMVGLKIGSNNYTSPGITVNNSKLRAITRKTVTSGGVIYHSYGLHGIVYQGDDTWIEDPTGTEYFSSYPFVGYEKNTEITTGVLQNTFGITLSFSASDALKISDTIKIFMWNEGINNSSSTDNYKVWFYREGEVFDVTLDENLKLYETRYGQYDIPYGVEYAPDGSSFAHAIFERVHGHRYQAFQITGAQIVPNACLGDTVETSNTYAVLAEQSIDYNELILMDISSPSTTEIHASGGNGSENYAYSYSTSYTS